MMLGMDWCECRVFELPGGIVCMHDTTVTSVIGVGSICTVKLVAVACRSTRRKVIGVMDGIVGGMTDSAGLCVIRRSRRRLPGIGRLIGRICTVMKTR